MTTFKGIDVSQWQGNINFNAVKASGIDFVIIRAGYGHSTSQKDPYFEQNYTQAKNAGLNVGAYWYSYADSANDAKVEADTCLSVIAGKQFDYPIYFDLEERSQFNRGSNFCSALVSAFCSEIEAHGYYAGLYISRSPLQTYISSDVAKRYALWIAEYNNRLNYSGEYGIWQYSSTGDVSGISGSVDMDYSYIDYPAIIKQKGLNGYGTNTKALKSTDEIVKEVLAGQWGNGDERKNRLTAAGYNYDTIQATINQQLNAKSADDIAHEVILGKWGNDPQRSQNLRAAGYDPATIQKRVNQLL